jgi:curved DNA-binding protein CbpA
MAAPSAAVVGADYYGLLGVAIEATAKEVAAAYRRKALTVHPDKNPDNPKAGAPARASPPWTRRGLTDTDGGNAAALFHELSVAYEVLSDASKRAAYDGLVRARLERLKRHEQLDSKRRKLKDGTVGPSPYAQGRADAVPCVCMCVLGGPRIPDLVGREQAARAQREQEEQARRDFEARLHRLRDEGLARQQADEEARARALFDQAEREALAADAPLSTATPAAPVLETAVSPLDKTLKVRWDPTARPHTEASLRTALEAAGDVDSLVLSAKRPGTAVVAYQSVVGAVRPLGSGPCRVLRADGCARACPAPPQPACGHGRPGDDAGTGRTAATVGAGRRAGCPGPLA